MSCKIYSSIGCRTSSSMMFCNQCCDSGSSYDVLWSRSELSHAYTSNAKITLLSFRLLDEHEWVYNYILSFFVVRYILIVFPRPFGKPIFRSVLLLIISVV
jgi:hypothetical protein